MRETTAVYPLRPVTKRGFAFLLLLLWAAASATGGAEVEPAGIFGNNMVLQSHRPVPVWGKADPGERVRIRLGEYTADTTSDAHGNWRVALPALEPGGPYTLSIQGKNTIRLDNVMVGEVWLCAGEGNMEYPLQWVADALNELKAARVPGLRLFKVPPSASSRPETEIHAQWSICTPRNAVGFSAVAYYFGRRLHEKLDVPVGLIQASWKRTRSSFRY